MFKGKANPLELFPPQKDTGYVSGLDGRAAFKSQYLLSSTEQNHAFLTWNVVWVE